VAPHLGRTGSCDLSALENLFLPHLSFSLLGDISPKNNIQVDVFFVTNSINKIQSSKCSNGFLANVYMLKIKPSKVHE
jgi:hypothetical protein